MFLSLGAVGYHVESHGVQMFSTSNGVSSLAILFLSPKVA